MCEERSLRVDSTLNRDTDRGVDERWGSVLLPVVLQSSTQNHHGSCGPELFANPSLSWREGLVGPTVSLRPGNGMKSHLLLSSSLLYFRNGKDLVTVVRVQRGKDSYDIGGLCHRTIKT